MEKTGPTAEAIVEQLTRREKAILAHLAKDKSNREIAALETLAVNSVKWYVQQVFTKLGVNRRSEAIARARELGLLKPELAPSPILNKVKTNLPAQLSSFIGRQKEIAELRLLLSKNGNRMLTLTGPGGIGKTRLALNVAVNLLEAFPDGIWLVELAPLVDPMIVPQAVIAALGLIEQPGRTPTAFLADYLQRKHLLLILDNCEHLVEASAELAAFLLHSAPGLTILATSREILGVEGEIAYRIFPMMMPDDHRLPSMEELARFDAVQLFVERAQLVSPSFTLTENNAVAVAQITERLDGIPLAIELAAARLRLLSANQIIHRLDDVFQLLTGGSRTSQPRHQTLKAMMDWSYDLLSSGERSLLRALSIFAGGWTLEAAEEVCGAGLDVLDLLGRLADKSLILVAPEASGEMRFRMLETVRMYAHAKLVAAGENDVVSRQHLSYYLLLAEQLEPKLRGREQISSLDTLQSELDNLRLTLAWALKVDVEAELRLASALQWFWHIRCHWAEGISWLEKGLESEVVSRGGYPLTGSRAVIRAKALAALGFHVLMRDNPSSVNAKPFIEEAISFYRVSEEEHHKGLAWALVWMSKCILNDGDPIQARSLIEQAQALFHETNDPHGKAECLQILGDCEIDPLRKKRIHKDQLAIEEAHGDVEGIATALNHIASIGFVDGDFSGSCAAFQASREHYRRVGNPSMVARNGLLLAILYHLSGDLKSADRYLNETLIDYQEMANDVQIVFCLFWRCMIALAQGCYAAATEIVEEADQIVQKVADPLLRADVLYYRARLSRLDGDVAAARLYIDEGLRVGREFGNSCILELLELAYLELQSEELARASALLQEGLQLLIRWKQTLWMGYFIDGLAILALRKGRLEHAGRLLGTWLWRGISHTLSPIELAEREIVFAEIKTGTGKERFEQLLIEGDAMTFEDILSLAQDEG